MNLWIRSQDKTTIIRPVSISLDNLRTSIFGYYCGDYYKVLGRYKTEERALEVLDDIQKVILGRYSNHAIYDNSYDDDNQRTIVYEMPIK